MFTRLNLSGYCLARAARASPDKAALRIVYAVGDPLESWTYAQLELAVRRVAAGLLAEGLRDRKSVV